MSSEELITKLSPRSVADTVARLSAAPPAELASRYGFSEELAGRLRAADALTDAVIAG